MPRNFYILLGIKFKVSNATDIQILRTKLHRPPVPEDHVQRSRLLERLEKGRQRPLTLVSASAGYGKSSLVSCWLETCDCSGAWVSLDENENDLRLFLAYFLAAVNKLFPEACKKTRSLLNADHLVPLPGLVITLVNELDRIEQPFILVLDDYYFIKETSVHDVLIEILNHPPELMHLVVISRYDPPLPLIRYRAKGQMNEITSRDLNFSKAETKAFLQNVLAISVDDTMAAALNQKTEGWVTGLRLSALAMRHRGDTFNNLIEPQTDVHYVMEYLFNEILSKQPPGVRHYLLSTAILSRFCAPLCDVLRGPEVDSAQGHVDPWNFIASLKNENMFIISLDAENHWFRYHHLFRELLRHQLKSRYGPEEIAALHARASAWFAENGLIEEALHHALAANDTQGALRLVARHRAHLVNHEQWHRLDRWMNIFSATQIEEHPAIVILKFWRSAYQSPPSPEALNTLNRAEKLLTQTPLKQAAANQLQGEIDFLRSFLLISMAEIEQSQIYAQRVLEKLTPENFSLIGSAHCVLSVGYYLAGDPDRAFQYIEHQLTLDSPHPEKYQARLIPMFCYFRWWSADLSGMPQPATRVLKIARKYDMPESVAMGCFHLGCYYYIRNELPVAEKYLAEAVNNHLGTITVFMQNTAILALTYLAQGRSGLAREFIGPIHDLAIENQSAQMLSVTQALQAEIALREGRLSDAIRWARHYDPYPLKLAPRFYVPQLTLVKVLLARNTQDTRQQAADLLDRLHDFFSSIHITRFRIDVLALQALLQDVSGNEPVALEKLTESLSLAEPGGLIRNFVDLGAPMADLLDRLIKKNIAVEYIKQLLAAFTPFSLPPSPGHPAPQPLVEQLTNRELDILKMLAQRLQNKEISEKLFISAHTVNAHLKSIYRKLDVRSRRQAVARARVLGIL